MDLDLVDCEPITPCRLRRDCATWGIEPFSDAQVDYIMEYVVDTKGMNTLLEQVDELDTDMRRAEFAADQLRDTMDECADLLTDAMNVDDDDTRDELLTEAFNLLRSYGR